MKTTGRNYINVTLTRAELEDIIAAAVADKLGKAKLIGFALEAIDLIAMPKTDDSEAVTLTFTKSVDL